MNWLLYLIFPIEIIFRSIRKIQLISRNIFETNKLQSCGSHFRCGYNLQIQNQGIMSFGNHLEFGSNVQVSTYSKGKIEIGDHVLVGDGTKIISGDANITIGKDSLIAEYVSIRSSNHGIVNDFPIRSQENQYIDIEIGRDVWIGRGVMITAGSNIQDGVVIGANSVVTKSLITEKNAVYVGNPARFLYFRPSQQDTN